MQRNGPDVSGTPFLRINPGTGPIATEHLKDTFERLHSLGSRFELEVRIVADDRIEYYVGTDSSHFSTVEHALRGLFPDGAQFEPADPPDCPAEPAAALEVRGRGERREDWQTQLRPVIAMEGAEAQFPLSAVVDALADAESMVHYQAILTPKLNWGGDAAYRIDQLKRNRDTLGQRFVDFLTGSARDPLWRGE